MESLAELQATGEAAGRALNEVVKRKKGKVAKVVIPPLDEQRQRIEYMDLDVLLEFPENPRGHDLSQLGEAFEQRGFVTPLLMDETSGLLVEGHGRLRKLKAMRDAGEKAPGRIVVMTEPGKPARWLVPVVRGTYFANMEQATQHLLAANRIGENLWDGRLTATMLSRLGDEGLSGTGFFKEDYARFLALADPWKTDIDVGKAGEHTDGIPGKVVITCPAKKVDEVRELVKAAVKRRGLRGVEVA